MELTVGESNETLSLKARVESLPYEEITPDLRARLSVEMIKDAVNVRKITLEDAQEFATSLIQHCSVSVVIGTPEAKVFPIEKIIEARPVIVENLAEAAKKEGINYEEVSQVRRQKAEEAIVILEKEYERQNDKYGSFAQYLSPEQRDEEMGLQAQRMSAAKQVLQTGVPDTIETDEESLSQFILTDVPNVYFGKELQNWLNTSNFVSSTQTKS